MEISILTRHAADFEEVKTLLEAAKLPVDDLESDQVTLYVATVEDGVAGAIGIELHESAALLRSLVVRPGLQKGGLGKRLTAHIEHVARAAGATDLYLLTETAADFFERLGYSRTDRGNAPDTIRRTRQFSSLCPDSADFLHKHLAEN